MLGKMQRVLVERVQGNRGYGMGEHYVPVEFTLEGVQWNQFYIVKLTELTNGTDHVLEGILV